MKNVQCDLCDVTVQGENFEAWMMALMPHYMKAHPEVMNNPHNTNEDKNKWMKENRERFEAA